MKKSTSIGLIEMNFTSINDTKSMNEKDPFTQAVNISRVSPSPYLFTRIQAKVNLIKEVPQPIGWISWSSLILLGLIFFIEIYAVKKENSSTKVDLAQGFSIPTEQLY